MTRLETIEQALAGLSEHELSTLKQYIRSISPHPLEKEWGIDADTILTAIHRSSDLTKRGVRGIIAEAVFESSVATLLQPTKWKLVAVSGDLSYDAMIEGPDRSVRVQIKLQRLEKGEPKLFYPKHYTGASLFAVEVQKTRSGETTINVPLQGTDQTAKATAAVTEKTRPYKFGDFDILAVNMHPSSNDWKEFRYTVASWLLPRRTDEKLIDIFQPVAATPNEVWTDNFLTCLDWLESGQSRTMLAEVLHIKGPKLKRKSKKKPKGKRIRKPVQNGPPETGPE